MFSKRWSMTPQRGFIKLLLIVVIAILVLTYFGFNFREVVNSPTGQDNLSFLREIGLKLWHFVVDFWNNYVRDYAEKAWIFVGDSWGNFREALPLSN